MLLHAFLFILHVAMLFKTTSTTKHFLYDFLRLLLFFYLNILIRNCFLLLIVVTSMECKQHNIIMPDICLNTHPNVQVLICFYFVLKSLSCTYICLLQQLFKCAQQVLSCVMYLSGIFYLRVFSQSHYLRFCFDFRNKKST